MDQPELDPTQHRKALGSLVRINRFSFSAGMLWPAIRDLARSLSPRPLRLLDLACGAGDVAVALAERARRAGLDLQIAGCDLSPVAIDFAQRRALDCQSTVSFRVLDVLNDSLPSDFDVVTSSLFLHHLDEDDALKMMRKMSEAAGRLVLVNDLARGRLGFLLAWGGSRLLSRSPIVHVDAPLSVEGAFTPAEALKLAEQAGLHAATVRRRWPFRYLLRWSRPWDRPPGLSKIQMTGQEAYPT